MIRVLLAEDVHMVRGALVALLEREPDIEVVAEVSSGDEIVPTAKQCHPDVAIIDINLPGRDGLVAAAEMRQKVPDCRTLILTSLGHPGTARRALAARVEGFILKDAPADKLANAVRSVAVGRRVIDGELAAAAWDSPESPLTDRELEVLSMAANGTAPDEIADILSLSVGTVRNYLSTSVTKLGARNRVDAIRIAKESGWL